MPTTAGVPGGKADKTAPAKKNTSKQPGNDILVTTAVELLGVGVFTILAGISDDLGRVMVVIMWGIVIGWLLLHTDQFSKMVGAL